MVTLWRGLFLKKVDKIIHVISSLLLPFHFHEYGTLFLALPQGAGFPFQSFLSKKTQKSISTATLNAKLWFKPNKHMKSDGLKLKTTCTFHFILSTLFNAFIYWGNRLHINKKLKSDSHCAKSFSQPTLPYRSFEKWFIIFKFIALSL